MAKMARNCLIVLEFFLQAVAVQSSELRFDTVLPGDSQPQQFLASVPLNDNINPSNFSIGSVCQHGLLSLHHDHAHLHDDEEVCPKEPTSLADWPAGMIEPWTNIPACSSLPQAADSTTRKDDDTERFCVFTSTSFLGGRGISIVTKPEIAVKIAQLPAFKATSHPKLHRTGPPPFEIKYVQGKGMGVIANRTIIRGEQLFAHSTIGIFHNDAFPSKKNKEYGLRTDLLELGVERLPEESRAKLHAMIGQPGSESEIVGKLNVNTFGEEFGDEEHSIIIPETARMNHDCRPNAMYYFDPETLVHYTHAATTIQAGEEITITYIDPIQSREERQEAIERSWGFECTCTLCTQNPSYIKASDGRIAAINELVLVLQGTKNRTNDQPTTEDERPAIAELLVVLYEIERLYSHIVDAWTWAAVTLVDAGKKWEALKWAYKSEEGLLIHEGPKEEQAVKMENMVWDLEVKLGLEEEWDEGEKGTDD